MLQGYQTPTTIVEHSFVIMNAHALLATVTALSTGRRSESGHQQRCAHFRDNFLIVYHSPSN